MRYSFFTYIKYYICMTGQHIIIYKYVYIYICIASPFRYGTQNGEISLKSTGEKKIVIIIMRVGLSIFSEVSRVRITETSYINIII